MKRQNQFHKPFFCILIGVAFALGVIASAFDMVSTNAAQASVGAETAVDGVISDQSDFAEDDGLEPVAYKTLKECKEKIGKCLGCKEYQKCCKTHDGEWALCDEHPRSQERCCPEPKVGPGDTNPKKVVKEPDPCQKQCYCCSDASGCERGECKRWSKDGRCLSWHCRRCSKRACGYVSCCEAGGCINVSPCKNQSCPYKHGCQ